MKYRLLIFFLAVFLLSSCSPRSSGNSHPEPDASISSSEAEAPSKEEEKPASQESAVSEEASAVEEETPPQEEYPVPLLTETEKTMLSESLALFAQYIGPNNIGDPSALPKDLILNASLAEIERTKEINAYFFEQDDQKNDFISASLVADTALRLFGAKEFSHKESSLYNGDRDCYLGKAEEISQPQASEIQGAPDGNIAYVISFSEGDYLYTGKILRQNGIPYLQFISSEKTAE